MSTLFVTLTNVSPTQHRFRCIRQDGSREEAELETKTHLYHDLLHFAVESEAFLTDSFYGKLLKGESYHSLSERKKEAAVLTEGKEIMMTERVVGVMTGVLRSDASPQAAINSLRSLLSASGEHFPVWFTEDYVIRVKERMCVLWGEWNGTPFRETMTLEFSITS